MSENDKNIVPRNPILVILIGLLIIMNCGYSQNFVIEKDYFTLWDRKVDIVDKSFFNLNNYPILISEEYETYKQVTQHQYRKLVYPNLGIVVTIRKDYLNKKLQYRRIEGISLMYNMEATTKFWFKGNIRKVKVNKFFTSTINIYGQEIAPLADYDVVLGDSSSIIKYMDRSIYYDPDKPDKRTAILYLDHFFLSLIFDENEKLSFLSLFTR